MEEAIKDMALLSAFLKRIWWDSHRYFEMVSRFDIFMFFLLLLPVGIQWYVNIPLGHYIDQKKAINLEKTESKVDSLVFKPLVKQEPQLKDLTQEFLIFFPEKNQINDDLFQIKGYILKRKLEINSIEYEYEELKEIPLYKVKMKIKLKGNYRAQRNFTYDLFSNFPYLSMPVFSLKGHSDQIYESDTELNLYYRLADQSVVGVKDASPNL